MDILKKALDGVTWQRFAAVILGNLLIGLGATILRMSGMGNDPFNALVMAMSEGLGVGLGNYQLSVNLVLLIVQLVFGRKYLGLGTLVNMTSIGYIIQFFLFLFERVFGLHNAENPAVGIAVLMLSLAVISCGLSMYQCADLGIAPYDFLSVYMTKKLPITYFVNRIITDFACVAVILAGVATRFICWENSHLGLGTILTAFCIGPFIAMFSRLNERWICTGKADERA